MLIYFLSRLCSYLPRVRILVNDTLSNLSCFVTGSAFMSVLWERVSGSQWDTDHRVGWRNRTGWHSGCTIRSPCDHHRLTFCCFSDREEHCSEHASLRMALRRPCCVSTGVGSSPQPILLQLGLCAGRRYRLSARNLPPSLGHAGSSVPGQGCCLPGLNDAQRTRRSRLLRPHVTKDVQRGAHA